MEKRFTIKKGKHYFKGLKFQEITYPLFFILLSGAFFISNSINDIFGWISIGLSALFWVFFYFKMKDINIKVKFDKSCLYDPLDNEHDINKLWGMGFVHHHKNSARFGWRCMTIGKNKIIEIHAYCYIDGKRVSEKLIECMPNEWVELDLDVLKDRYQFKAQNIDGERALKFIPKGDTRFLQLFTYKLFPYFGGNNAAPHDMEMTIIETEK